MGCAPGASPGFFAGEEDVQPELLQELFRDAGKKVPDPGPSPASIEVAWLEGFTRNPFPRRTTLSLTKLLRKRNRVQDRLQHVGTDPDFWATCLHLTGKMPLN